mmetsp:Transcript_123587/g.395319  ORF Transcript_123587/g.395319 Transcript_123587/m.395319 type:complete len:107 (-) Transcript_123587:208-528(-)
MKTAFRQCTQTQCASLASKFASHSSAHNASMRYSMRHVGDNAGYEHLDPTRSKTVQRRVVALEDLVDCEKACAQKHWPAAEGQPWIGTVAIEMANVPRDQSGGRRR